ncbi:LOW QUALITY PROTEIN: ladderlectin-like [Takifugu flavidus]|uniref:LOW QUALITY PROTEIN: ladderlectin-like n=1 Tax=Takifugu flavidus TaxID=433684 RepID=UPI0025444F0A|nr:LOW QUALITY PROTEIN: ladderlectin-like [Takifugu flavidus]
MKDLILLPEMLGGYIQNKLKKTVFSAARFNFCPSGWFTYGYRCYIFVNSPMNWYSAKDHCKSLGANLASVSSPREYSFLQQMTKTAGQSTAWLGGFYREGRWLWIDNEGFYYTNWYSQASAVRYPCMFLYSTFGWSNTLCTSAQRFICSKTPLTC